MSAGRYRTRDGLFGNRPNVLEPEPTLPELLDEVLNANPARDRDLLSVHGDLPLQLVQVDEDVVGRKQL